MAEETGNRIVVGVDGSPASKSALAWALEEASLRSASVHVVHAWQFPSFAFTSYGTTTVPVISPEDIEKAADRVLQKAVTDVAGREPIAGLTTSVEPGHPAEVLVAAAKGADLLVVGSRGHGGFAGMLLGSVSGYVVHHATCPVVVIRDVVRGDTSG